MITFTVFGVPVPKGSTRAFYIKALGRAVVTHDNKRTAPWQESVVDAARQAVSGTAPLEGPVTLNLRFYVPRPKSAPRRVVEPTKKPDLDKLCRCVKDGLTRAGVYRDDSQVVAMLARKEFAGGYLDQPGGIPRVEVVVDTLSVVEAERFRRETGALFAQRA